MMESTRQKTFKLLGIILSGSIVSLFILLLSPAHSIADQCKVVQVEDGDPHKIGHNCEAGIIYLPGIDATELHKNKNESGQSFSQAAPRHIAGLVSNKSSRFPRASSITR
jgi:endonuclease YncB( thermonuclease family)